MNTKMTVKLLIWRQLDSESPGKMKPYTAKDISPDMSFLEMLDFLNEDLIKRGESPIEFDSDCREGICGTCGLVIDGVAHGPRRAIAACQLHMRHFEDGQTITVEPLRARPFPLVKDLVVDRGAFDRISAKGAYISISAGSAPEANLIPIAKEMAEKAMDAGACIGCGACVAACPNGSASLFVGARISQFVFLPQGHSERRRRALRMVEQMDREGFGDCSNHAECEAVCPKEISIASIARMRREYLRAVIS